MNRALHARDYVERLYESNKGERGPASIEDCVETSILGLENYIKKAKKDYL